MAPGSLCKGVVESVLADPNASRRTLLLPIQAFPRLSQTSLGGAIESLSWELHFWQSVRVVLVAATVMFDRLALGALCPRRTPFCHKTDSAQTRPRQRILLVLPSDPRFHPQAESGQTEEKSKDRTRQFQAQSFRQRQGNEEPRSGNCSDRQGAMDQARRHPPHCAPRNSHFKRCQFQFDRLDSSASSPTLPVGSMPRNPPSFEE